MLELYQLDYSTCSQKVRICLAEKGIEWVNRPVNTRASEHLTPEYLKLNPNGVVPTMVHDGKVILDSSVMCEYLDEVFPQNPLTPKDPVERARMRAWMRFLEEVADRGDPRAVVSHVAGEAVQGTRRKHNSAASRPMCGRSASSSIARWARMDLPRTRCRPRSTSSS